MAYLSYRLLHASFLLALLPLPSFIIVRMEFLLGDPNVERFPPESTRLLDLRVEQYPDGRRIHVNLELTPFLKRPEIELTLTDPAGEICASATIIEPMGWKLDLTMHLPASRTTHGVFTLTAQVTFPDLGEVDCRSISIDILPAA